MSEDPKGAVLDEIVAEMRSLRAENEQLRAKVEALAASVSSSRPAATTAIDRLDRSQAVSRRRVLTQVGGLGVGAVSAYGALAMMRPQRADAFLAYGLPLVQNMSFGDNYTLTPLDSSVRWDRTAPVVGPGATHEVLSLLSSSDQLNSFAWPLFIEMRGTTHPSATTATSQSTGCQVRAFNRGVGAPWVVGFHSEVHHGANFDGTTGADQAPAVNNQGTTIGYNLELVRKSALGRTVGMNLHNNPVSQANGTEALLIKGSGAGKGWDTGIRFEPTGAPGVTAVSVEEDYTTGVAVRSPNGTTGVLLANGRATAPAGTRGLAIEGRYETGIDVGPNSVVMQGGQKLYLEATKQVWLRYNPALSQIEFGKGTNVIGHIQTSSGDHAL